jgi:hypothetical protein
MAIEWQGDHRIIGNDIKQGFERELEHLGLAQRDFIVEVRRETDLLGAAGLHAMRYKIFVTELEHPDKETWTRWRPRPGLDRAVRQERKEPRLARASLRL